MEARPHPDGIPDALDVCLSIELHARALAHPHLDIQGLEDQPTPFSVRCYCFNCGVDVGPAGIHDITQTVQEQRSLASRISQEQMERFVEGHIRKVHAELIAFYAERPEAF